MPNMDEIELLVPWADEFTAWVMAIEQDKKYQIELQNQLTNSQHDVILDL